MTMKFQKRTRKLLGKRTHGYGRQQGRRKTGRKSGHGLTTGWIKGLKSKQIVLAKLGNKTNKFGKNRDNPWIIGKHGFKRPVTIRRIYKVNAINIGSIDAMLDSWVEKNLAEKSGTTYTIDLKKVGYQKILAKGSLTKKINVTVEAASENAIEEIENAGGKVTLTEVKEK